MWRSLRERLRLRSLQRVDYSKRHGDSIDNVDAGSASGFLDYDPSSEGRATFPPGYVKPHDDRPRH